MKSRRFLCYALAATSIVSIDASAQAVREFSCGITPFSNPHGIALGPDGNLWFAQQSNGSHIGQITPSGVATEFSVGITSASQPYGLTLGPDGNLWFTEQAANKIGRITLSGVVTEFSTGISLNASLTEIAAGPDGNLWFTEEGNRIGRITTNGVITEFAMGITANSEPTGIASGPDGNVWFTEYNGNAIGQITPMVWSPSSQTASPQSPALTALSPGPMEIFGSPKPAAITSDELPRPA
jgi:streptogramin lyase